MADHATEPLPDSIGLGWDRDGFVVFCLRCDRMLGGIVTAIIPMPRLSVVVSLAEEHTCDV